MKARMRYSSIWLLVVVLAPAPAGEPPVPVEVHGRLSHHGGLPVLEVWGSPAQAGFAHGYLLAGELVALFDETVLSPQIGAAAETYEQVLRPTVQRLFRWDPRHEAELEGILRGVQARLGPDGARSRRLDRPLTVLDLKVVNTLADWRGVLCSSFSAWGDLTAAGQTITARNLDYASTPALRRGQLVLVHRGDGVRQPWVGLTWPGLIGVYTAMNRAGVTMAMHDSNGLPPSEPMGLTPRSLALRSALEAAGEETWPADVAAALGAHRVLVGNNVHVSGRRAPDRPVARVFEYDGGAADQGVTPRGPDADTAVPPSALICTNHMRVRRDPIECRRYAVLEQRLNEVAAHQEKLDVTGAFAVIRLAAQDTTIHTVVFTPRDRSLYIVAPPLATEPVRLPVGELLTPPAASPGPATRPAASQPQAGAVP